METRYAYVTRVLTEAIAGGRHPLGSILPNEHELAEEFEVSRSTIRAAMRELQASGLISRKRNAGTRVESLSPQRGIGGFTQTLGSIEAVQQYGIQTERRIQQVTDIVADDAVASDLGCRPGRRWMRISFLRTVPGDASKMPICWTDVYIDGSFAGDVRSRMNGHSRIFSTLVEEISGRQISEIRQSITAVGVSDDMSGPLKTSPGAHALAIRRQYFFSSNEMAEISLSIHPADRFSYASRLTRHEPATGLSDGNRDDVS